MSNVDPPKTQIRPQTSSATGRPSRSISPNKRRSIVLPSHIPFSPLSTNGLSTPARGSSPEHDNQTSEEPDILTALAGQERLVLELKESLVKAEEKLVQLKRQWATHESMKRRNESRRMHQMKPLTTSPAKLTTNLEEDSDGSSAWMYEEMERRKALLGNTRSSHRRVFSGSREARKLSLLSPIKMGNDEMQSIANPEREERKSRDPAKHIPPPVRPRDLPTRMSQDNEVQLKRDVDRSDSRSPQREALLQTGKQMATDFRDGLWTFLEDLRQVAVGDDIRTPEFPVAKLNARRESPVRAARPVISPGRVLGSRKKHSSQAQGPTSEEEEAGDTFWKEQGLPEPTPISTPTTPKRLPKARATSQAAQIEAHGSTPDITWDAWGSPASSIGTTKRSSATFSLGSRDPDGMSTSSSMDATIRPGEDRDKEKLKPPREAIPWPELTKLAPANFKRTASQLMAELERNLTPSPQSGGPVEADNGPFFIDHGLMH